MDGDIRLSLGYILIPGEDEATRFFIISKFKINLFPRFEYFFLLFVYLYIFVRIYIYMFVFRD